MVEGFSFFDRFSNLNCKQTPIFNTVESELLHIMNNSLAA